MKSIWEEIYGDFLVSQNKQDGPGNDNFLSVEAKVEDIRRRVGLKLDKTGPGADLQKSAAFCLTAQEDPMVDIISAAMALASRPMADKMAVLKELELVFPEHKDLIRENRDYLIERIGGKKEEEGKPLNLSPLQTADEKEDSKIFESISDKVTR